MYKNLVDKNLATYLHDGLHLSDEGNRFLASLLSPHVEELTNHLEIILPDWKVLFGVE